MAFVKYEIEESSRPAVRINRTAIVVQPAAWGKAGLDGTEFVNLWWDEKARQIGVSSTDSEDKSKFSARATKRGISIAAKKFFDKFSLGGSQADGGLKENGGVVAFKIGGSAPAAPASKGDQPPRRRGRRPKNATA